MAIPRFDEDLAIISKLGDNPGSDNNLTTDAFRAKFDEGAQKIQQYLNEVLIPATEQSSSPQEGLTMQGAIDMNGQPLTGLKEPEADNDAVTKKYVEKYADEHTQQVKKAAHRNLLDNSDFKNPVNQRGTTSYSGSGYGIDRWRTNYAGDTVAITSRGVKNTINSTAEGWHLHQIIDKCNHYVGKTLTVAAKVVTVISAGLLLRMSFRDSTDAEISSRSVKCSTGVIVVSGEVPTGTVKIRVGVYGKYGVAAADYIELEWTAMYEGAYTTETLPNYQPKGYAAELLECQRYYYCASSYVAWSGYKSSTLYGFITLPVRMRITPTVTTSSIEIRGAGEIGQGAATATISTVGYGNYGNSIRLTLSASNVAEYQPVVVVTQGLEVSADL